MSPPRSALPFAAAVLGAALVGVATARSGALWSPDSVNYLSAAESFLHGEGFVRADTLPMAAWPPLYPMVLAAAVAVAGRELAPAIVNALSLAALGWLCAVASQRVMPRWGAAVLTGVVLLGDPTVSVAGRALSESLFLPLLVAFVLALDRWWECPDRPRLAVVAALAAACALTRYLGVSAVAVGLLAVTCRPSLAFGDRARSAVAVGLATVVPLGAWIHRNGALTGTLAGMRRDPRPAAESLAEVGSTLAGWITPALGSPAANGALALVALLGLVGLGASMPLPSPRARLAAFAGASGVAYTLALGALAVLVHFDPPNTRLLSPVWPMLVLAAGAVLASNLGAGGVRTGAAVLLLACAVPALRMGSTHLRSLATYGVGGFGDPRWSEHALVRWVRQLPPDAPVYSNYPDVLYLHAGRRVPRSPLTVDSLPWSIEVAAAAGPVRLVWFAPGREDHEDLDALRQRLHLREEVTVEGGAVYVVEPKR